MKLKDGFVIHETNGESMVVATGAAAKEFNGLIRNNSSATFIFKELMNETTEEAIVAKMAEKYDAPVEVIKEDVHMLIEKLRSSGFLNG